MKARVGLSGVGALSNAAFLADRPITHALVLGGSGFLGAPLVRRLCAAGVRTTCLLHRRPPPVAQVGVLSGSVDSFPWRALEEDPPDVIFHLARIAGRGGIRGALTRVRNRVANERLLLALASWARAIQPIGACTIGYFTPSRSVMRFFMALPLPGRH